MNKTFTLILFLNLGFLLHVMAQDPLTHQKRIFRGEGNKLYINKDLPVYLRIATSSDDNADSWLLYSETSRKYTNPMYLDAEGWNSVRTPSAVDTATKRLVTPIQDIVFELYTDGIAPVSLHMFEGSQSVISKGMKYFGKQLSIIISAKDENSGIDKTYFSINKKPWTVYSENITVSEEGEYELQYYSVDNVGNVERMKSEKFVVDFTAPVTTHSIDGINKNNVIARDAKIILNSEDKLSGVRQILYSIDEGNYVVYNKPIPVSALKDGEAQLKYYAVDNVGNSEEAKSIGMVSSSQAGESVGSDAVFDFYIDREPPVVNFNVEGDRFDLNNLVYLSERSRIKLEATDDKSGVQAVYYSFNAFLTKEEYKGPFTPGTKGNIKLSYNGVDWVDNVSQVKNEQLFLDNISPVTQIRFEGPRFLNRDTLFVSAKTKIILNSKDTGSGLKETIFSIDQKEQQKYNQPFSIEEQGFHSIGYFAKDNVNNMEETNVQQLYVDIEPPVIHFHFSVESIGNKVVRDENYTIFPSNAKLYIAATDNLTGGEKLEYRVNGGETKSQIPVENFIPGNYEVVILATDVLGNQSSQTIKFAIEK